MSRAKDKAEPRKAKANKVEGRYDSPVDGDNDKPDKGKANLVDTTEEDEETDSNDEEGQGAFVYTVEAEGEKQSCSARESLKLTPRVSIKIAMSLSTFYQKLPYLPCLACPDTGASCNVLSERERPGECA